MVKERIGRRGKGLGVGAGVAAPSVRGEAAPFAKAATCSCISDTLSNAGMLLTLVASKVTE
jgi:hypothetical protein